MIKAYIKGANVLEVNVRWRTIDRIGIVNIKDDCGVEYLTHISNVIFVEVDDEN